MSATCQLASCSPMYFFPWQASILYAIWAEIPTDYSSMGKVVEAKIALLLLIRIRGDLGYLTN